jgi:serine phosphatase RsbU (regulator of sigma subunit)
MDIRQFLICAILLLSATSLYGNEAEGIRNRLPQLRGEEKLEALSRLLEISRESDDFQLQINCLYAHLNEARRQGIVKDICADLLTRATLFYNHDENDSLFCYAREDLDYVGKHKLWVEFYRMWFLLANTYVYSDSLTTGLKEAQTMYEYAKERKDSLGQGLAYLAMGNAYYNMHDMEEASEVYQKAINQLMMLHPLPVEVPNLFSSQCDVLERLKAYQQLRLLTVQWKKGIDQFIKDWKLPADYPGTIQMWAYYYIGCAQATLGLHQTEQASEMLGEARRYIPSKERDSYRSWLFYQTKLCQQRDAIEDALSYNNQLLPLVEGIDDKEELIRVKRQRAEIMTRLGKDKAAAELYREIYLINDSTNILETKRQLAEMNARFNVDELEMKQARLEAEQARLEMEKAQQQRFGMIIITFVIVISLIIFIYFRLRSAKRLKVAHEELEEAHSNLLLAYDQLEETTAAKERIESDLRIARDIQRSMVPSTFPDRPDLDLYASMAPAKMVGGDLYGYLLLADKLYFTLGDVSGKGVPASLFMAQATRLFRTLATQQMMPAEICTRINDALSGEDNEQGMFVTMFIGLVNLKTGHLDFCNAGHNPPVLVIPGKAEFLEMQPNAPIGLWPGLEYEGEELENIMDIPLFVYSDGLNEAENRQQEQFSDERLLEILQTMSFVSSQETIETLEAEVEKHRDGAEPNDDLTMLCVKIIRKN